MNRSKLQLPHSAYRLFVKVPLSTFISDFIRKSCARKSWKLLLLHCKCNVNCIFESVMFMMLLCLTNSGAYILLCLAKLGSTGSTDPGCSRINLFLYMYKKYSLTVCHNTRMFITVCMIQIVHLISYVTCRWSYYSRVYVLIYTFVFLKLKVCKINIGFYLLKANSMKWWLI